MILLPAHINRVQRQHLMTALEGEPMPCFNLLLADGVTRVSTGAIPPGSPVVVVLFSPECHYCQAMVESIVGQIATLAGIHFYLVTPCPVAEVREFSRRYRLDKYSNIVVGMDYDNFLLCHSKTTVIPYITIYDRDMRLKEAVFGPTDDRKIKEIVCRNLSAADPQHRA